MKGERCWSIIGCPGVLITRSASNKVSNQTKAGRLTKITELEKMDALANDVSRETSDNEKTLPKSKGKKRVREEDETEQQTDKDVSKRPVKRARKSVRKSAA